MKPILLYSKPHYQILDGLRGVASIVVVIFHIFEAHSAGPLYQVINHGYLAVDFFFLLSGFVIGYAYDDRWKKMTAGDFFKRRLIRLQPMVIMGSIIGACCFYFQQSSVLWPNINDVPVWYMLVIMLIGFTLIPIPPSMDIRGWQETYPLNGPAWSLFYEYFANVLYATIVRKFSKAALAILVFLSACALIYLTIAGTSGDVIGGWSLEPLQLQIGFTRLLYPFFAGLLLYRIGKRIHIKYTFFWCSLLLVVFLSIPRIGGSEHLWMNGLYESITIIFIFPLIVCLGAGSKITGKLATRICKFLGDISYPLYITHYPLIYIYTAWAVDNKRSIQQAFPVALLVLILSLAIAYACLKLYDEPVRLWLKKKVLLTENERADNN